MSENKNLEILKGAILLEHKGKAFYESVAKTSTIATVKEIFSSMAMEEAEHIDILTKQYVTLRSTGKFEKTDLAKNPMNFAEKILDDAVKSQINGAGYEAAAISAALSMEKQAVEFYGNRGKSATDPAEIELYNWLADWETSHVDLLVSIDNELRESIWFDQKFWPVV